MSNEAAPPQEHQTVTIAQASATIAEVIAVADCSPAHRRTALQLLGELVRLIPAPKNEPIAETDAEETE